MTTIVPVVVLQHTEDAAILWIQRDYAVRAPHYALRHLADHDDRVAAHLDGLDIAGEDGWRLALEQFRAFPEPGEVFTAASVAIVQARLADFEALIDEIAALEPEPRAAAARATIGALGWGERSTIDVILRDLLKSGDPFRRLLGIGACGVHRHDPGHALAEALHADSAPLRTRAAKAVSELGRHDLSSALFDLFADADESVRFWAATSALRAGDGAAGETLAAALESPTLGEAAAETLMRALAPQHARALLEYIMRLPARTYLRAVGALGDPADLDELLTYMDNPELARVTGEAFSMITGVDIAYADLERAAPDETREQPSDDLASDDVAADPDLDLQWPDPKKLRDWLSARRDEFTPGQPYVAGRPTNPAGLREVLRDGFQRQRRAAAERLLILEPGRPMFPVSAPAKRQRAAL
jgi:uncharacterized protein (TIGR02270 family)